MGLRTSAFFIVMRLAMVTKTVSYEFKYHPKREQKTDVNDA